MVNKRQGRMISNLKQGTQLLQGVQGGNPQVIQDVRRMVTRQAINTVRRELLRKLEMAEEVIQLNPQIWAEYQQVKTCLTQTNLFDYLANL
jgi:hypothetical protein